ncbi:MAG: hypothetical protein AB3N16_14680, partial [Flavobacteriaceae bacterium]
MKFCNCFTILFCFVSMGLQAQEIADNTIGLRLGDSDGFGAEVSYQHKMMRYNRLEANLGFRNSREFNAVKLAGVFQWLYEIQPNLNWYFGGGGGLGYANFENEVNSEDKDNGPFLFVAGNAGIEYGFDFPLLLS